VEARVFDSENRLRHLPFFEEIASLDEAHADWRAATAGLVVLRLVDAWLEDGPAVASDDSWSVRSVRNAIDEMDDGTPIRALLGRVVDALNERKPDIHVVVTPLMAFGRSLEYAGKWVLAADVYHTVLAHLHPLEDGDASIAAHLRLGQCYRNMNQLDDAAEAFASASSIADGAGDMVGVLRAQVGHGIVALLRGNLPGAEEILDDAIERAVGVSLSDVRSRALHVRSNVAQLRGQYELAVRFGYQALSSSETPTERDRILSDMGVAFMELGVYTAARDAYLVLSATAQEQYIRWAATINLLEISSKTGVETFFEAYRRELTGQALPPYLATAFELNVGIGYRRFGNFERARGYLERALALATEHGLSQYLFEAEEALFQLETSSPAQPLQPKLSLEVEEVANAIRELRESVGVS
jgi:tetratricopeptide (TPR) repeat protein